MKVRKQAILFKFELLNSISILMLSLVMAFVGFMSSATAADKSGASSEQPMLVFVHSMQCGVCAKVRPLIVELEKEYKGQVQFVDLDVTNDTALKAARKKAKSLGIMAFLSNCEDQFPCVGIFKTKEKLLKEMYGAKDKDAYVSVIKLALEK